VSFAAITLCVAYQRVVVVVVVYFIIDSIRKVLDTLLYAYDIMILMNGIFSVSNNGTELV